MQLHINGQARDIEVKPPTVAGLVAALSLEETRIAVERNGAVIPRADHASEQVQSGDRIEIVTLVGGG